MDRNNKTNVMSTYFEIAAARTIVCLSVCVCYCKMNANHVKWYAIAVVGICSNKSVYGKIVSNLFKYSEAIVAVCVYTSHTEYTTAQNQYHINLALYYELESNRYECMSVID